MNEYLVAENDGKTEDSLGCCFLTSVEAGCPSFGWLERTLKSFEVHPPMVSADLAMVAEPKAIVAADEASVEVEEEFDYRAFD